MTANEKPVPLRIADLLGQIEECTGQIQASAESIANVFADDEDEAYSLLWRATGALEVLTLWLMHEEDDAKRGPGEEQQR
jgi:hypothetical protein